MTLSPARPKRRSRTRLQTAIRALAVIGLLAWVAYLLGRMLWAEYHLREARAALDRRDLDAARSHLARYLDSRPDSAEAEFLAARAARRANAYDEATRHLNRSKELGWEPKAIDLELLLTRVQRGEVFDFGNVLMTWVDEGHPDAPLILEALAQGCLTAYQLPAAMQCLQKWLELEPDAPQALYWRGEAWERLHRFEEALTDFQRVIDLRPDRDDARLRLATALVTAHRPAEAVGHYELLHAKHPDASGVVLGLARCRVELGHADEARQLLDDLLPSRPNDGLALGERGKIELLAGSADDAERWLRRAAAAAPYEREVVYNLIQALQKRGKSAEAADWTARLDKIDTDLERMNELLRKIHGSPKDPASRHEAGAILMRNGQEIEGVRWLMNALKQDPDYRPSHELLADYYERHGNPELAAMHRRAAQGHATSPMP